jgi:N-acetylglucosamine-6-phosphate deacetylase
MSSFVLKNANIVAADRAIEDAAILVDGTRIVEVGTTRSDKDSPSRYDLAGCTVFPGFVDVHCHGAIGVDVNEANVDDLLRVAGFLASQGVTSWLPTLVPDSDANYQRVIGEIDRLMEVQKAKPVAQAVGVHYEGVFANDKMCGALRPEYFRSGRWAMAGGHLPKLKQGLHMTTLAPEVDGGIELIEGLVEQGWIVSIGHTAADVATLDAAFAAGAGHLTHFFNAMTGLHHRDIGVVGWGLANDGVTFDIIADGVHVHPRILAMAARAKTTDRVTLISDSVAPTGLGDGDFQLWGETISVVNGRTRNERGSIAGSVSTMLDGVRMMRSIGFSDVDAAKMAATNPARLLGTDHLTGSVATGKSADLVVLDQDGNVKMTVIRGQIAEW